MPQAAALDMNLPVDPTVPLWNETRWNGCWSPTSGAGLYIHAGRRRGSLDLWWVHQAVYLPGGSLAVDRFWTRNTAEAGIRSELLDVEMTADGWQSSFDGVCELTTREALGRTARGSSAPSARVRWDVTAAPATPRWDMYAGTATEQSFASALHYQQAWTSTGTLSVDERTYALDGVGFSDHSAGARSHQSWNGHRFLLAVMPGYSVHAVAIIGADGVAADPVGVVITGDEQRPVETFEALGVQSVADEPAVQTIRVTGPGGREVPLRLEIVQSLPHLVTPGNEHLNGVDWEIEGDPLVMFEAVARLTAPDGTVGWGHFERSARRSTLRGGPGGAVPGERRTQ